MGQIFGAQQPRTVQNSNFQSPPVYPTVLHRRSATVKRVNGLPQCKFGYRLMRWVAGRRPHPSPLPQCGRGGRECAPASALYRLGRTTKFSPVTRLARNASEPVTKLACNSKRPNHKAGVQWQANQSQSWRAMASDPVTKLACNGKRPNQQAVMERVCDEKSGEGRGDHLKITTQAVACFRKIFAA